MEEYELIGIIHRCELCDMNCVGWCRYYYCTIFNVLLCTYTPEKEKTFADRLSEGFEMLSDDYEGE